MNPYNSDMYSMNSFTPFSFHLISEFIYRHIPYAYLPHICGRKRCFEESFSPHTVDGCKLIRHRVDKVATCRRKRCWYFICSLGKVMRQIDDSHFAPDSVGKINVS